MYLFGLWRLYGTDISTRFTDVYWIGLWGYSTGIFTGFTNMYLFELWRLYSTGIFTGFTDMY
jgi:hypothetical protein